MVRQYIGARYVTKVYENSLDPSSAEWEATVTYEPLTMVTYNNSSYLSKKQVPGSVGDPASNPDYWVVTGAYNGQILALQNQINAINTQISGLSDSVTWLDNKNIYVFGDSLSEPKTNGLWENVKKLVPSCTINNMAVASEQYSQIATRIANTDLTDADVVFILGGTNNWQGNTALNDFYGYVNTSVNNVLSQNSTCKIVLLCPPFCWSSNFPNTSDPYIKNDDHANISDYGNMIKLVAFQNNIPVIDLYNESNIGNSNYTNMMENSGSGGATIYVHPLAKANEYMAGLIVNQVYTDKFNVMYGVAKNYYSTTGVTVASGAEAFYDPNSGALTFNMVVNTDAAATTPDGYLIEFNFPYGSWLLYNEKRIDNFRFPIMDYTTMTTKLARIDFNSTHYNGALQIEGTYTLGDTYIITH